MAGPLTIGAVGWGVAMAGWIISPYITRLIDEVYSHIKPGKKSRDNLHKLKTQVIPRLKLILEAADGTEHKELFEELVRGLKSAFRDTEDILDELEYIRHHKEARQRKRKLPQSGPSDQTLHESTILPGGRSNRRCRKRAWQPICRALHLKALGKHDSAGLLPGKIPRLLSGQLEKNIEKIQGLIDAAREALKIENEARMAIRGSNLTRGSGSANGPNTTAGKVTGRDDVRDRIMRMLEADGDPSSNDKYLCVIGIYGLPGSGKTTLAQHITQAAETSGYFDLVLWIHVSEKYSVDIILREMFEQAWEGNGQCPQHNSLVVLKKRLKQLLTGKRFLLVLDDVWCSKEVHEQKKLPQLLPPLIPANRGSKILVTSRHHDALSELGPDVRVIDNSAIPELDDEVFLELLMRNAFGQKISDDVASYGQLLLIGAKIAQKLKKSPLLAIVVGQMLYRNHDVDHWESIAEQKILEEYMGPLWWCYQHLDEQVKRCFAYCSIFPRRRHLYRDELVNLWVAEGFISTTKRGRDMQLVSQGYFDELLSISFLQPRKDRFDKDYFVIHDLLHDLTEMVAGSNCFRIEDALIKAPPDVCHLSVESCSASMITEDIVKLKDLRTLIIFHDEDDVNEELLDKMLMMLTKLRVLIFQTMVMDHDREALWFPRSINYLKHLRYLGFQIGGLQYVYLPATIAELYLLQVLDFGFGEAEFEFPYGLDTTGLTNLGHVIGDMHVPFPNIGRLTSLQTMPRFRVQRGHGYELHQLGALNKLRGKLDIFGVELVKSKEEALKAKLADKQRLTSLSVNWFVGIRADHPSPEVQADVLEGLCPPGGLECLTICRYEGSRYPEWMYGPKESTMDLHTLVLQGFEKLIPTPGPEHFFIGVTSLKLYNCKWDSMPYNMVHLRYLLFGESECNALPGNMDQLTSLKSLIINMCKCFLWIPALPTSLEYFELNACHDGFTMSCKDEHHANYKAIQRIPEKHILGIPSVAELDKREKEDEEYFNSTYFLHADGMRRGP